MDGRAGARSLRVLATANFAAGLDQIAEFLADAGARAAFSRLLDRLFTQVIPNLQRFPRIGADFLRRKPSSVDGAALARRLEALTGGTTEIRELVFGDYLVLYALRGPSLHLLSIRHHRKLTFDLRGHWALPPV
jgi:plasmid stabilization system protein ParE